MAEDTQGEIRGGDRMSKKCAHIWEYQSRESDDTKIFELYKCLDCGAKQEEIYEYKETREIT